MKTLTCEFIRTLHNHGTAGRNYDYLYSGTRSVRAGDWAIVHNGTEFGIVTVKRVRPGITDKVEKHVLSVITQDDFLNYQEANRGITEHRRVFDQLDYMLEQDKTFDKYKELAGRNPEAAELLKRARVWSGKTIESILDRPFTMEANGSSTSATLASQAATSAGDSAFKAAEIPLHVYYSAEDGNFYNAITLEGMGTEFYRKWMGEKHLFPASLDDARIKARTEHAQTVAG